MELLYHDGQIAVCRKQPGALSEAGPGSVPAELAAALGIPQTSVYPVHRLDRTTGGLMVYALTKAAAAHLSEEIRAGRFEKEYLALAEGTVEPGEDALADWLYFDRVKNRSYVVKKRAGAKEARLTYRVVRTLASPWPEVDTLSLCRVHLETGRTHQIRVQLSSRQHPLAGDRKYGARARAHICPLWSVKLAFAHPDGRKLAFALEDADILREMGLEQEWI